MIFLLAALIYFIAPVLISSSAEMFGHGRQEKGAQEFSQVLWPETAMVATLLVAVVLIGWLQQTGLTTRMNVIPLFFAVPYVLFVLVIAAVPLLVADSQGQALTLTAPDWRFISLSALAALLVGAFEELLFRGVLLHGLRTKMAAVTAVFVSAAIFGAFHFVNWVGGQPIDVTVMQVLGAAGGGVFYGAMVLWTGSLWSSIVLHGVWDTGVTVSQTLQSKSATVVAETAETTPSPVSALASPELIYGLIILGLWWMWSKRQKRRAS